MSDLNHSGNTPRGQSTEALDHLHGTLSDDAESAAENELTEQQLRDLYDSEEIERFINLFSAVSNRTLHTTSSLSSAYSMLRKSDYPRNICLLKLMTQPYTSLMMESLSKKVTGFPSTDLSTLYRPRNQYPHIHVSLSKLHPCVAPCFSNEQTRLIILPRNI